MRRYINLEDFDSSLTVAELKAALTQEEEVNKLKEKKEIESINKEFSNVFLKTTEDCLIFGKTLKVYHVDEIADSSRTTEWNLIYFLKGTRVSFSKRDINKREMVGNDVNDTKTEKELRSMLVISEEEYNKYVWHFEQISKQLEYLIQ